MQVELADGLIRVTLPVRCDQTGDAVIEVVFAVGSAKEPSGLYASTYRRPNGPALIVDTWGEALVAFAWQCVLGMVTGIAGAVGKDTRGNVLVPAELIAANGAHADRADGTPSFRRLQRAEGALHAPNVRRGPS